MFEKICDMLVQQLEVNPDIITMDTNIVDDLGADSLDVVELIMALEDEYGVMITDEQATELTTVGAIARFLEAQGK
ncbi:MAG: acyl carrier protein [Oscillospiraceae bacterium]|nr:acyl carrier protein [Oscillospiraceae bacterium]